MANRYWVGGSGTWGTGTTNWSDTNGGAGGFSAPTASDDVFVTSLSGSPTISVSGFRACKSLTTTGATCTITATGSVSISGSMTLSATTTWSNTGELDFLASGTITTNGVLIQTTVVFDGVGQTFTLGGNLTANSIGFNNGTLDLSNNTLSSLTFFSNVSNTRVLAFGTGNITVTGSGSPFFSIVGTNFSYTGTPTINVSNNSSTASSISCTSFTESTAMDINITLGTYTLTVSATCRNLNLTGFAGTFLSNSIALYGDLTIPSGVTIAASASGVGFNSASAVQTINAGGVLLDFPIGKNGSGTLRLSEPLNLGSTRLLTLTAGTIDANGFDVSVGGFTSGANLNTKALLMGSGTWTLTGTGSVWGVTNLNLTFNKGTANIVLSDTSTTARTFAGGGLTYNNLTIGGSTGSSVLTIAGSNTFNTFTSTKTVAHTLNFTSGTTTTVNTFAITGSSGNIVTLKSSTAGSRATIRQTSGTVSVSYMDIKDSNATGGAAWTALLTDNNVDSGNNAGWIFVAGTATMFLLF